MTPQNRGGKINGVSKVNMLFLFLCVGTGRSPLDAVRSPTDVVANGK